MSDNMNLILTTSIEEEDDDAIIGELREQIKQQPQPRRPLEPEEYDLMVEYYRDMKKPEVKEMQPLVEYIPREQKPTEKYSYFLTAKPKYKWQWPLLWLVRLTLQIKNLLQRSCNVSASRN